MPNITYKSCYYFLYYYPHKVCNFHMQVFQIQQKYHYSKPIKLQKFLMQWYNQQNLPIYKLEYCIIVCPKAVNGYCVTWLASTFFSFPTFATSENTLLIFSPPSRPALQKMTEKIFGVHCHAMKNKIANHSIQKDQNLENEKR